jgi:hypothetical protein
VKTRSASFKPRLFEKKKKKKNQIFSKQKNKRNITKQSEIILLAFQMNEYEMILN